MAKMKFDRTKPQLGTALTGGHISTRQSRITQMAVGALKDFALGPKPEAKPEPQAKYPGGKSNRITKVLGR
ncbi:MAG: hypothetical protein WAZ18_06955 [Alphaproteobacteria bacterium]